MQHSRIGFAACCAPELKSAYRCTGLVIDRAAQCESALRDDPSSVGVAGKGTLPANSAAHARLIARNRGPERLRATLLVREDDTFPAKSL
jgi:hypothetical protein